MVHVSHFDLLDHGECDGRRGRHAAACRARSGVALAMERWGCREDPNSWQWGHLTGTIEQFLRESPVKYLGDAWMLAQALAEEQPLAGDDKAAALVEVLVGIREGPQGIHAFYAAPGDPCTFRCPRGIRVAACVEPH